MKLQYFIFLTYVTISSALSANELKELYLKTLAETAQWKQPLNNSKFGKVPKDCTSYGSYDFIIVGGGTAGAVVANRLSANGTYDVLLLEVGGDELEINQYLGNLVLTGKTESNWGYLTEPQKHYCQLSSPDHRCSYARGEVLGGCSSINGAMYVRGNKDDFKTWVRLGNKGWSFEEVLPYYIKSENATSIKGDKGYHGSKGPLHVTYNEGVPHQEIIFQAYKELGLKTLDYNGENQIGISKPQLAKKDGRRFSTNKAYLEPIKRERDNLKIVTNALATRIKFHRSESRATEVYFLNNQKCFSAHVDKEVIISSGVVNSPQLLLLSGIGPKDELKKFNIPLYKDLPVGKYFEEHPSYPLAIIIKTNLSTHYDSINDIMAETVKGTGGLARGLGSALIFKGSQSNDQIPNFEIISAIARMPNLKENEPVDANLEIALSIILFHAKSRGDVKLKSDDPIDFPKINPNCFSEEADTTSMYNAIRYVIDILDTKTFKKINGSIDETSLITPGCKKFNIKNKYDEEFWKCLILQRAGTSLHGSGTCRMGVRSNDSVVNRELKIHGINNVRVVDASSFPRLPTGHPMATVIMLAEKASDIILEYFKK